MPPTPGDFRPPIQMRGSIRGHPRIRHMAKFCPQWRRPEHQAMVATTLAFRLSVVGRFIWYKPARPRSKLSWGRPR